MKVFNAVLVKTDSEISEVFANEVDTDNVEGQREVTIDYSTLSAADKAIVDAWCVLMESKLPA
jgi:hypothetical protein